MKGKTSISNPQAVCVTWLQSQQLVWHLLSAVQQQHVHLEWVQQAGLHSEGPESVYLLCEEKVSHPLRKKQSASKNMSMLIT